MSEQLAESAYNAIKEDHEPEFEQINKNSRYQLIEIAAKGGDSTPFGQKVGELMRTAAEPDVLILDDEPPIDTPPADVPPAPQDETIPEKELAKSVKVPTDTPVKIAEAKTPSAKSTSRKAKAVKTAENIAGKIAENLAETPVAPVSEPVEKLAEKAKETDNK